MRSRWPHASRTSGLTPKPDLHRRHSRAGARSTAATNYRRRRVDHVCADWAPVHQSLIVVLLVAGGVTLLLAHYVDAAVIFGVVVINAVIGFVQEGKAEDALAAVRGMLTSAQGSCG